MQQTTLESTQTLGYAAPPPVIAKKRPPRKKRRWILWLAGGAVVVVLLGAGGLHHVHQTMLAAMPQAETAVVKRADVEKYVESAGKVTAYRDADIKCRASGLITKLPVEVSQQVKTGDLLCQLDPKDEELAVSVAKRTVEGSTANLQQMQLSYQQAQLNLVTTREKVQSALVSAKVKAEHLQSTADRQKQLKDQKLGSEEDYETAQTNAAEAHDAAVAAQVAVDELAQQELQLQSKKFDIDKAKIQLSSDEANLDTQQRQLDYTTVFSTMDGTVSSIAVNLSTGSMVESGTGGFSGGTTIMTLTDLSHINVKATVDQSDIRGVKVGQLARIEVDSYPDRNFEGKVTVVPPVGVNTSNVVTFEVTVEVTDNDRHLLKPQMTGTVQIIEDQRKDVIAVPTAAVEHRAGQTYVKLADGKEQQVTLGLDGGETVEVLSGLKEGDKVTLQALELPTRWKSGDR